MQVEVIQDLLVRRAPDDAEAPWLDRSWRTLPRWQLTQDFIVEVDGERHSVPAGFIFNGSSVPWFLWWLYPPSWPPAWRGSCVHDMGVGMAWQDKPQDYWDRVLHAMILLDGGSQKDADRFYWAVSRSSRGAYRLLQ